jgi:hypothetical protein
MAATPFQAHRPSHLPALTVVDPATGNTRLLTPREAALRVETFGPLVVVAATYVFEPAVGEGHCRMTFPERAHVYEASVGGDQATFVPAEADSSAVEVVGVMDGDAVSLRWSTLPGRGAVALELAWVQVATQDGFGWSTRLPVASRVSFRAHQTEEAAGNGTGWRTEGEELVAEGAMRPFTLFWWPERHAQAPRLHLYACGTAGLAVLTPPRQAGSTLPRDVRVLLAVKDASQAMAQRVAQSIRAGLGAQDAWRLVTPAEWQGFEESATPGRCVQTLVITDGTGPGFAALLTAAPATRVIGLGPSVADAHLRLDPAAGWARNRADLEAFLAPMESVWAQGMSVKSRLGKVLTVFGEVGAIGLTWRTLAGVDGPCEVVGSDGQACAQALPVSIPHEEAWRAFEMLVRPD